MTKRLKKGSLIFYCTEKDVFTHEDDNLEISFFKLPPREDVPNYWGVEYTSYIHDPTCEQPDECKYGERPLDENGWFTCCDKCPTERMYDSSSERPAGETLKEAVKNIKIRFRKSKNKNFSSVSDVNWHFVSEPY